MQCPKLASRDINICMCPQRGLLTQVKSVSDLISDVWDVFAGGQQEPGGDAGGDGQGPDGYGRGTCLVTKLLILMTLLCQVSCQGV